MSDIDRVPYPPALAEFCAEADTVGTVLSCKRLDAGNFAVLIQLKTKDGTVIPAGTVQIADLEDHDVIRLKKLEGENQNPIAEKIN